MALLDEPIVIQTGDVTDEADYQAFKAICASVSAELDPDQRRVLDYLVGRIAAHRLAGVRETRFVVAELCTATGRSPEDVVDTLQLCAQKLAAAAVNG
jgi:hypothetical protein